MSRFEFEGYSFETAIEKDIAKKEAESITYIRAKIDVQDKEKLRKVYETLIAKQSFVTPIGIGFLRELQTELSVFPGKPLSSIVVAVPTESKKETVVKSSYYQLHKEKQKNEKREINKLKLRNARIINFFLIIIIVVMFVVVLFGNNSPFMDAEEKIQDKYAAWEQELMERERSLELREQEK